MFFFTFIFQVNAQNLDKIGKEDILTIHGGINFTSLIYFADGIPDRRDPFSLFANGNLNASILDWSIPVSYSYSNRKGNFSQPFNRFTLSPTYKWIKTFMGYQSLNYSPYTLAGHLFYGGGFELTPKNWKIGAMYGRLFQAHPYDEILQSDQNMTYKRMGLGLNLGYKTSKHGLQFIFFRAQDDPNSIPFIPLNTEKTPMENMVVSLSGLTNIKKNWFIEGEYALSGLNRNLLAATENNTNNYFSFALPSRVNTTFYQAYKSSLRFQKEKYNLQLQYEHVDPDYKTLGGYFFNNDLKNYTLASSFQLWKGKVNSSINTGYQKNNLDENKMATTQRWIGSINISVAPSTKLNLTGSFSNFSTFTKNRIQPDPYFQNPTDTLNFYQVNRNATISSMLNLGTKSIKHILMLNVTHMVTGQEIGAFQGDLIADATIISPTKIYNGNFAYTISESNKKLSLTIALNGNYMFNEMIQTLFWGPNLNISKPILKNKVRLMAGSTFNQSFNNGESAGYVLNHRIVLGINGKGKSKISMNATLALLQKLNSTTSPNFMEFNGNIAVNYNF